ncbi:MAG: adenine phosphoribosyltransferase [Treponema sp.]|nr:adenine phosphoribosyltransferase [Treponema sp.]
MKHDIFLDDVIRKIPNFPKPGILFYDITGILINPPAFSYCINKMISLYKKTDIDSIAAIESRGFVFAAPLAEALGLPLVLIRKKGKLPGKTFSASYALEYGTAEIEVHQDDIKKGQKLLVVDDLIATGGTLNATKNIIERAGASVTEFFGIVGLPFLNYKDKLGDTPVTTLIEYFS